eukprot:6219299-Pyramimonas_sp.AAC.1
MAAPPCCWKDTGLGLTAGTLSFWVRRRGSPAVTKPLFMMSSRIPMASALPGGTFTEADGSNDRTLTW